MPTDAAGPDVVVDLDLHARVVSGSASLCQDLVKCCARLVGAGCGSDPGDRAVVDHDRSQREARLAQLDRTLRPSRGGRLRCDDEQEHRAPSLACSPAYRLEVVGDHPIERRRLGAARAIATRQRLRRGARAAFEHMLRRVRTRHDRRRCTCNATLVRCSDSWRFTTLPSRCPSTGRSPSACRMSWLCESPLHVAKASQALTSRSAERAIGGAAATWQPHQRQLTGSLVGDKALRGGVPGRGAQHPGIAELDQRGPFGVLLIAQRAASWEPSRPRCSHKSDA